VNVSDSDKLIAFRIHGASPEFHFGDSLGGAECPGSDKLIAFRIHGVAPEMVRSLKQAGYDPDPDKLIAMRNSWGHAGVGGAIEEAGLRAPGS